MLPLDVAGQEILTKDKVALRINLNAGVRFVNVLAALAQQAKPLHYLYRELQFGCVRPSAHVRSTSAAGMEVASVGVKNITLPGEMKTILARVVEAKRLRRPT